MARLTSEQKEIILADWHTGQYSQRKLAERHKVSSRTVNILVKVLIPKHKDKVNASVAINTALAFESKHEVNAVNREIDERTRHMILFQNSAIRNQLKADEMMEDAENINELNQHSQITQRNKETVLGKDKTVELNNTNAVQNNSLAIEFK